MAPTRYVNVALPRRLPPLTYAVPSGKPPPQPGIRVVVPFRRSQLAVGIVVSATDHLPETLKGKTIKEIYATLDEAPLIDPGILAWWQRLADYYLVPLGGVLKHALPRALLWDERVVVRSLHPRGTLPPEGQPVWRLILSEGGAMPLKSLKKRAPSDPPWMKGLDALLRSGWVEIVTAAEERAEPVVTWIRRTRDVPADRLSPRAVRQRRLWEVCRALPTDRWVPLDLVLKRANVGRQVFLSLLKKGMMAVALRPSVPPVPRKEPLPELPSIDHFMGKRMTYHRWGGEGAWRRLLALVKDRLAADRQVVLMVPDAWSVAEYGSRLRRHFPGAVFSITSDLPDKEVVAAFEKAGEGAAGVYLGTRRPIFWPYPRLGAIVVIGENNPFFKNRFDPFAFHVRDVAISRFTREKAPLWLTAYTPSVETYYNVVRSRYRLADARSWLDVFSPQIWDLRAETLPGTFPRHWTPGIQQKVVEAAAQGRRVLVVVNRRGTASYLGCARCGWVARCLRCHVPMTYYHHRRRLECDHCGHRESVPSHCPECGAGTLRMGGEGVQGVAMHLETALPGRVVAAERSAFPAFKKFYRQILPFVEGEASVLVTTPYGMRPLTVRGVALLLLTGFDTLLTLPSYRAHEQAWALIVKGGSLLRHYGATAAQYWMATRHWDHPLWKILRYREGEDFYRQELAQRAQFGYPPMARLITMVLAHRRLHRHHRKIDGMVRRLQEALPDAVVLWNPDLRTFRDGSWQTAILIKLPADPMRYHALKRRLASFAAQNRVALRPLEMWFNVDPWE